MTLFFLCHFIICDISSFFSIGEAYANLYMATDPHCESPKTLEKWKYRGKIIFQGAQEMCRLFVSKVFTYGCLNTLRSLLSPLRCIFKLCTQKLITDICRHMKIKKKIELQSIYNPSYENAWQMDCFHYLIEIGMFIKQMRSYLYKIEENNNVIAINP